MVDKKNPSKKIDQSGARGFDSEDQQRQQRDASTTSKGGKQAQKDQDDEDTQGNKRATARPGQKKNEQEGGMRTKGRSEDEEGARGSQGRNGSQGNH